MPFLSLNVPAILRSTVGYDSFGQNTHSPDQPIMVAVISYKNQSLKSPMRAGQSASVGRDDQQQAVAKMLVSATLKLKQGDVIEVFGSPLLVSSTFPRRDIIRGEIAHIEVLLSLLEE